MPEFIYIVQRALCNLTQMWVERKRFQTFLCNEQKARNFLVKDSFQM